MPLMKLDLKDPNCGNCILSSTVELIAGAPCQIKVHVVLAPPPIGYIFPKAGETVTAAQLKYNDDDGNTTTKQLGPPTGPAFTEWTSANAFDIQVAAATWLTSGDFAYTTAELKITTSTRFVIQRWKGIVP
jgi:hypothetical protein